MATLLIKGLNENYKALLKKQAQVHHRSMNQEALMILEKALTRRVVADFVPDFKISEPMTSDEIVAMIRHDRDFGH